MNCPPDSDVEFAPIAGGGSAGLTDRMATSLLPQLLWPKFGSRRLEGADITGGPLWTGYTPLIARHGQAGQVDTKTSIDGRTGEAQRMGLHTTPVVLQWRKPGRQIDAVAGEHTGQRAAACCLGQVVSTTFLACTICRFKLP